jgi:hypothetical protein
MNMSYCKYQNTLAALRQIAESQDDEDLSVSEKRAKENLCQLMMQLVGDPDFNPYYEEEDDY